MTLYDLNGRILKVWHYSDLIQNNRIELDAAAFGLEPGMYLLKVNLGENLMARKIVVP